MAISPSDLMGLLPWWGWLFCSVGGWATCIICQSFPERERGLGTTLVAFISGLIAILAGNIAVTLWLRSTG